ncbi:MAG: peptidoglycan DD-metalloendopeptidase family protein [Terriglobales bacterium]
MSRNFYIAVAVVAIVGCAAGVEATMVRRSADEALVTAEKRAVDTARSIEIQRHTVRRVDVPIRPGANFAALLQQAGLQGDSFTQALAAAQSAWNLRQIIPGHQLWTESSKADGLKSIVYRIDSDRELWIVRHGDEFSGSVRSVSSTTRTVTVHGKIHDSLFESMDAAGGNPELAVRFADILAFDVDFYTDPRDGDDFSLVVEKKEYAGGGTAYGRIFAVRYDNSGQVHEAVLFHDERGNPAYYTADGKALQKEFLRSPLKFAARISSHFSLHRYHPILKIYRAHLGTDYAAPIGTPVQTIGAGRVLFAGRKGGDGNMVEIAHANGYDSYYLHLSRILVRRGAHVQQGQRIGLVGMTGLATGPHLDFRLQRRGQFVNFERMKLPPASNVAKEDLPDFFTQRDKYAAFLTVQTETTVASR